MPSIQHTQACVFEKIALQNWYFLPPDVRDR